MKYLRIAVLLIWLAQVCAFADKIPTFEGVCQLEGDWCTTRCQIAGGRDGICNKVHLCTCRPL
ncbi:uncharacterized protein LOC116805018 [Drosophila grimshawi]|uniref:uncharacterized protein LOC116805018 n=1 Tax=Drosophila grimshawi TaxID=7222 RepID=UPI000C86FB28|nr:uncharacterized protein LOC116805018 [Drosophila grimshawi]